MIVSTLNTPIKYGCLPPVLLFASRHCFVSYNCRCSVVFLQHAMAAVATLGLVYLHCTLIFDVGYLTLKTDIRKRLWSSYLGFHILQTTLLVYCRHQQNVVALQIVMLVYAQRISCKLARSCFNRLVFEWSTQNDNRNVAKSAL